MPSDNSPPTTPAAVPSPPGRPRLRSSVVVRLSLALIGLLLAFGLVFLTLHYRRARALYLAKNQDLIGSAEQQLTDLGDELLTINRQVVINSVDHVTDLYRLRIEGLPFALYRGREDRIKKVIGREAIDLGRVTERNTDTILRVVRRRIEAENRERSTRVATLAAQAQAEWSEQFRDLSILFVSLSALLMAGGVGLGLWRWVLRPVRALQEGTHHLAAGDLDYRIPVTGRDEMGRLAASFNAMAGEIQTKSRQVEELNQQLEQKVEERTRRLAATVTELEETQAQLLRSAKMASIGRLAGGVAHEFGNLVSGILGCADLARQSATLEESNESVEMIYTTSRRAQAIVDSLLRFARRRTPERRPTRLRPLVEDVLTLLGKEIRSQEIGVTVEVDPELTLVCDGDQLSQVLINLLTNAIHAVDRGGTVRIAATRREEELLLEVVDDGHGIDPAVKENIFEPFFTTKEGGGDSPQGTGLGLSVTLGIVEDHGGRIEVESTPGAGAAFRLTFPLTEDTHDG